MLTIGLNNSQIELTIRALKRYIKIKEFSFKRHPNNQSALEIDILKKLASSLEIEYRKQLIKDGIYQS